jgi:hypothetical protein
MASFNPDPEIEEGDLARPFIGGVLDRERSRRLGFGDLERDLDLERE